MGKDADCIHAFRSCDRHAFCKYELYAVCKLRIACNHPFRYASGRPPDPAALHPAADRRIRRRDIRSGNYRLYRGGPFNGILEKYKKKAVGFARVTWIILQLKNEIPAASDRNLPSAIFFI